MFLGRSPLRHASHLDYLKELSPSNKIVFVEAEVSLISGIDAACAQITTAERKADYLCMSPGGMPFQGAVYTQEGLETCFAVSYYSKLRLVSNLLPLLNQSPKPRVLSILNGTKEKRINEDDIGLEKKWSIVGVVDHTTLLTSLVFDYLASNDEQKKPTLIHATPGFVNTVTERTTFPSKKDGLLWWAFVSVMQVVSGWVIRYFGMSLKESGERHAFHLKNDSYGPGSWRIDKHIVWDNSVLQEYQGRGWGEEVLDFTRWVWDKALTQDARS